MLNLSPKKLKAIAKMRGIKGYKSMSESFKESEKNFDDRKPK